MKTNTYTEPREKINLATEIAAVACLLGIISLSYVAYALLY